MKKRIAWSNDEVFAISWLCNRYLDICRLKKRQARSTKVMIAKWRLHGSRVRLSNQLACDLDLACETRKRRDDRFKISSIHYFFPFSPAFSPPCSCSLFSTNFFSHAFLNHYSHIIFTMKNREIEITVQKSKKYRLQVSTWLIPSEFQICKRESINNNFNFFAQFFPPPWFTKEEENCPE